MIHYTQTHILILSLVACHLFSGQTFATQGGSLDDFLDEVIERDAPTTRTSTSPAAQEKTPPPTPTTPASSDASSAQPYECTPLHAAVIAGKPSAVKRAIASGIYLEARDSGDMTPLMVAAYKDRATSARLLLQAGANPNAANFRFGTTALMLATIRDHHEVVQELIQGGADINARNKTGFTALMLAARKGHTRIFNMLRQAGANPFLRDSAGKTAADYAAEYEATANATPSFSPPPSGWSPAQ